MRLAFRLTTTGQDNAPTFTACLTTASKKGTANRKSNRVKVLSECKYPNSDDDDVCWLGMVEVPLEIHVEDHVPRFGPIPSSNQRGAKPGQAPARRSLRIQQVLSNEVSTEVVTDTTGRGPTAQWFNADQKLQK